MKPPLQTTNGEKVWCEAHNWPSIHVIIFTLNSPLPPWGRLYPHQNEILAVFQDIYWYSCLQCKSKQIMFRFLNSQPYKLLNWCICQKNLFLYCISKNPKYFILTEWFTFWLLSWLVICGVTENVEKVDNLYNF